MSNIESNYSLGGPGLDSVGYQGDAASKYMGSNMGEDDDDWD